MEEILLSIFLFFLNFYCWPNYLMIWKQVSSPGGQSTPFQTITIVQLITRLPTNWISTYLGISKVLRNGASLKKKKLMKKDIWNSCLFAKRTHLLPNQFKRSTERLPAFWNNHPEYMGWIYMKVFVPRLIPPPSLLYSVFLVTYNPFFSAFMVYNFTPVLPVRI